MAVPTMNSGSVATLPALGLSPTALQSLRQAFAREVTVRLPRLLRVVQEVDGPGPMALARADAGLLADGCLLLGDAAAARALRRLEALLSDEHDHTLRADAAGTAALLLGRWVSERN